VPPLLLPCAWRCSLRSAEAGCRLKLNDGGARPQPVHAWEMSGY
jgi:hypothetical protein